MSAGLRAYAEREASQRDETNEVTGAGSEVAAPLSNKRVLISRLLARPDLNGLIGEAGEFNAASGRYTVVVNGESVALKAANLQIKRRDEADFAPATKVRIKGLTAKPELNGCGGTVLSWNEEKERYAVQMDGSLKEMLLRAANLERDKREAWTPAMHDPVNQAHIQRELERYAQEQMKNASPFAQMGLDEKTVEYIRNQPAREDRFDG